VWCRSQSTLRHYDTFAPCNHKASVRLMCTIQGYLGQEDITLTQMNCESQENGYDCGIILLAATDLLCERWLSSRGNENGENTVMSWELPLDISSKRNGEEFRNSLFLLINRIRDGSN
jgi:Ulp1 family protease